MNSWILSEIKESSVILVVQGRHKLNCSFTASKSGDSKSIESSPIWHCSAIYTPSSTTNIYFPPSSYNHSSSTLLRPSSLNHIQLSDIYYHLHSQVSAILQTSLQRSYSLTSQPQILFRFDSLQPTSHHISSILPLYNQKPCKYLTFHVICSKADLKFKTSCLP